MIYKKCLDPYSIFFQYRHFSSVVLEFFKVRHAIFSTTLNISYMIYIKIYIQISKHILVNYFQYFIGKLKKKFSECNLYFLFHPFIVPYLTLRQNSGNIFEKYLDNLAKYYKDLPWKRNQHFSLNLNYFQLLIFLKMIENRRLWNIFL